MSNARPWLKFSLSLAATLAWLALLTFRLPAGSSSPPPLGSFLNPFEGFYRSNATDYWEHDARLAGLRAPVDVYYDARMVPHLYASSDADLYFAQGYIQAQHRLFQLDLTARSAEGSLSEILGERTLDYDRTRRRIGTDVLAGKIDSLWRLDPATYAVIERYSEGINAYIATLRPHEYPVEYKLLDFAPRRWSPRHTALVAISMAFVLNAKNEDLEVTATRELLGAERFDFLFPERNPLDRPVIPEGATWWEGDTLLLRSSEPRPQFGSDDRPARSLDRPTRVIERTPDGIGSNNWVLAGAKTASGRPLLANDPHLPLTLPSIWFESELHAGELSVHGVNLPGVPGVTIGFNQDVAWGVTNVGIDVLDWYRPGADEPRTPRVSTIRVLGRAAVVDTVYDTRFGPIVYTEADDPRAGLAMNWLTTQVPSVGTINTFLRLNRAKDYADYLAATRTYEWPAQNFVFASAAGDIALRVSGLIPRRLPEQGRFVERTDRPAATGYLDARAAPLAHNPRQGYLTSTNQVSTDASYPYYYSGYFDTYRSRRSNGVLADLRKASLADMEALQQDNYSVRAADFLPRLLELLSRRGLDLAARGQVALLEKWDFRYRADALAPVIFDTWLAELGRLTWDELSVDGSPDNLVVPEDWRLRELLTEDPLSPWFDIKSTPEREAANDVVTRAFTRAASHVDSLTASDSTYAWADENRPGVEHLAKIPAFSRLGLRKGGRAGTLDAQRGTTGPSWRMIVELGPTPRARVVYPGGQSGRPGHPHYDDMVDPWAAGKYFDVSLQPPPEALGDDRFVRVRLTP